MSYILAHSKYRIKLMNNNKQKINCLKAVYKIIKTHQSKMKISFLISKLAQIDF